MEEKILIDNIDGIHIRQWVLIELKEIWDWM